tara:strand:+ start:1995 stop:2213 length:219 start_codon:yes stop_codon:yes gene_type:complete
MRKVKVEFWEKQIIWNLRQAVLSTELTDEEITSLQMKDLDLMGDDELIWADVVDTIYDEVLTIDDIVIIKDE